MIHNITDHAGYFVQNDMLMRKSSPPVPFVPAGRIRSDIIKIYHDTPANGAHFGRDRTVKKIQQRYFWPTMTIDIRNHLKSCMPCLQNNHQRQKPPGLLKPIKPPRRNLAVINNGFSRYYRANNEEWKSIYYSINRCPL